MSPRLIVAFMLGGLVALAAGIAPAGDGASDVLRNKLAEFPGSQRGQVVEITSPALVAVFPNHQFYALRFRQYPVAIEPPERLQANNVFVVKPNASVELIRDAQELETFARGAMIPVATADQAKAATQAWLRLVEEFHQDGLFQFSIPEDSLQVASGPDGGLKVTGKAIVNQQGGNAGEVVASLKFDAAGGLTKASEAANLKKGIRPICQATKLLDPDPIVRRMAEDAILLMGKAAKVYLDEQRARAGPALREAIDRIWQRILIEER